MSTANVDKIRIYRFRNQIVVEMNNQVSYLSPVQAHLLGKNLHEASYDVLTNGMTQSQYTDTIIQNPS